jgi:nitroreductase
MEVFDAIRTVRAVRAYDDRPLPPEVVRRIVESARLTASSKNGQPWHFIVLDDREGLRGLGALTKTGPYVAQAPLAVVVAVEDESPYGVSDASRAIQSMVLTAWADGVASNWVGFNNLDDVKSMLGIPDGISVVAVVPFGYPAAGAPKPRGKKQRKALGEIVHHGRFGRPFA